MFFSITALCTGIQILTDNIHTIWNILQFPEQFVLAFKLSSMLNFRSENALNANKHICMAVDLVILVKGVNFVAYDILYLLNWHSLKSSLNCNQDYSDQFSSALWDCIPNKSNVRRNVLTNRAPVSEQNFPTIFSKVQSTRDLRSQDKELTLFSTHNISVVLKLSMLS